MPLGYQNSSGVDLEDIFEPRNSSVDGLASATGYQRLFDGLDLRYLFAPASAGSIPSANTGYQNSAGTDLRHLFCAKGARTLISASVSPSSTDGAGMFGTKIYATDTATCSYSNPNGSVSFSWTRQSGDSEISHESGGSDSKRRFFTAATVAKGTYTAVFRCTVTDEISSAYDTIEVSINVI